MKYKFAKVFKKITEGSFELIKCDYSPNHDEYYSFLKNQMELGYRQVIITSEMMLKIVKLLFLQRSFKIVNIEFMVEEDVLKKEVDDIIKKLDVDRGYFSLLLDKLKFTIDESSIEIKKIELCGIDENNKYVSLSVQVNGIYRINEECFDEESKKLLSNLEGWL